LLRNHEAELRGILLIEEEEKPAFTPQAAGGFP
jgi:hypothetical protein